MKQFLLIAGGSLCLAGPAYAQVGVRAGTTALNHHVATSASDARVNSSGRFGWLLGVYYQHPLTKRLALVPELQFSGERLQQHSSSHGTGQSIESSYNLHFSYLNLPVLLRVALGPVYVEAGPQASLLVGGRAQGSAAYLIGGDAYALRDIDQAATDRYQRLDAGACLGVGVKLPAGLGLSVRAYQGFVALDRDQEASNLYQNNAVPYTGSRLYRQTVQASLTYQVATH